MARRRLHFSVDELVFREELEKRYSCRIILTLTPVTASQEFGCTSHPVIWKILDLTSKESQASGGEHVVECGSQLRVSTIGKAPDGSVAPKIGHSVSLGQAVALTTQPRLNGQVRDWTEVDYPFGANRMDLASIRNGTNAPQYIGLCVATMSRNSNQPVYQPIRFYEKMPPGHEILVDTKLQLRAYYTRNADYKEKHVILNLPVRGDLFPLQDTDGHEWSVIVNDITPVSSWILYPGQTPSENVKIEVEAGDLEALGPSVGVFTEAAFQRALKTLTRRLNILGNHLRAELESTDPEELTILLDYIQVVWESKDSVENDRRMRAVTGVKLFGKQTKQMEMHVVSLLNAMADQSPPDRLIALAEDVATSVHSVAMHIAYRQAQYSSSQLSRSRASSRGSASHADNPTSNQETAPGSQRLQYWVNNLRSSMEHIEKTMPDRDRKIRRLEERGSSVEQLFAEVQSTVRRLDGKIATLVVGQEELSNQYSQADIRLAALHQQVDDINVQYPKRFDAVLEGLHALEGKIEQLMRAQDAIRARVDSAEEKADDARWNLDKFSQRVIDDFLDRDK